MADKDAIENGIGKTLILFALIGILVWFFATK